MRSLAKIVARNSIVTLMSKLSVKFISFAFTILVARTLGEVDFGRYALIWSYVTIFAICSDFGLGMYIIREIAKGQPNSKYLAGNVIVFRVILATATFLLIGFTTHFIGYSAQTAGQIILAGTILLLYAVQDPLDSVLQAKERLDLSSGLRIVGQLVFVILGAVFLLAGWGITGLILASLCNVLISAVLAWYLIRRYWGGLQWHLQPKLWPRLLIAALPFGLIGFALNWSQKIDTVILSLFWPDQVIGWYNAAYSLILGMIIISNSFNIALYPTMSKETAIDYLALGRMYKRILKYLLIASLPLAVGFSVLSRPIILNLYGAPFAPAVLPLAILAWVLPLIFVSEFLRYTTLVVGQENKAALAMLLASLSNIILNFLFIPGYGLLAAAITTVLTEALLVTIYLWQLRAEISLLLLGSVFWKPALASSLMLGTLLLFSYVPLLPIIALGGITYFGTLFLLGDLGPEEGALIRELVERVLPVASHLP